MMATKTWTSTFVCRGRQTTARGGCNVQQKTSQKFDAIAKFLNQDGRPDRYWKSKRMWENCANHPHPTRERTHRHRSIPEIAVLCHLPRKTSQLPAEPEEWPKRWRNSEVRIFCVCHLVGQDQGSLTLTLDVFWIYCTIFAVFVDVWWCFTPYFTQFRRYSLIECALAKPLFLDLGGM